MSERTVRLPNGERVLIRALRKRSGFSVNIAGKLFHVNTVEENEAVFRAAERYMDGQKRHADFASKYKRS